MIDLEHLPAFLTVRADSSRLPRKCFLDFGGCSVLEHVIRRAEFYGLKPFVITTVDQSDDDTKFLSESLGVPSFRGSVRNKLQRWYDAALSFGVDSFHTVDVDDPFFAGEMVVESMSLLIEGNLDIVFPTTLSSNGSASVGYSIRASSLEFIKSLADESTDTEMVDVWLKENKNLKIRTLNSQHKDTSKARLTLDYLEDYKFLRIILKELGQFCSREAIVEFVDKNPHLTSINESRSQDWLVNQERQRSRGLT